MSFAKEISITVPAELVRTTTGLSMDFGKGSDREVSRVPQTVSATKRVNSQVASHGKKMLIQLDC